MLLGLLFLLLIQYSQGRETQCSVFLDTLTEGHSDYLVKYGAVVSLQPPGKNILECVPEYGDTGYGETKCYWKKFGEQYSRESNSFAARDYWTNKGCTLHAYFSHGESKYTPGGNLYNKYSCSSYDQTTQKETIMNYLLFFLSKDSTIIGFVPHVSVVPKETYAQVGDTVNVTCEADISQASSVFDLNWYRVDPADKSLVDVKGLERHNTSMCGRSIEDRKKILLTLTITDVTEDMWDRKYKCIVTKVDVWSPYNQTLSRYTLHSADPKSRQVLGLIPAPGTTDTANLSYYENGTESVCTQEMPCEAFAEFSLLSPVVVPTYVKLYHALAISASIVIVLAILVTIYYWKKIHIHYYIKHEWGFTNDLVCTAYDYQTAIFYADRSEQAEEEFVQSKLLVKLENRWKYKTFVPQRDYFIGSTKAEECVQGIKNSQKVIFILTEELFAEEWKIYALDVALNKHRKIILIKLEDINFQELLDKYDKKFSEVDSALKVSTVIDWTKQKHKWRRLHLEMPTILNDSLKHRITSRLRACLRSAATEQQL